MKYFFLAVLCAWAAIARAAEPVLQISAEQQQLLGIQTLKLDEKTVAASDMWNARAQFSPDAEWVVTALLPGTIKQWLAVPGQAVHKGDALVLIHSDAAVDLQREYLAARAQLQLDDAARARDENLYNNGVIAERRWLEAKQRAQQQLLQVNALQQRLQLAGFDRKDLLTLAQHQQLRGDYPLRAPADAVIVERHGELGEKIEAMAPLLRLGDATKIWLQVHIPARHIGSVKVGDTLQIIGGGTARVRFVNSAIDAETQTLTAMAALDDKQIYAAGTLLQVRSVGRAGLRIPANAIVRHGDSDVVFVAVKGGFVARTIKVSAAVSGDAVVQAGLQAGDRVAISGVAALKGMLVGMGGGE